MRKVCVVITARASYSRIKTVLTAINTHPDLELQLIVTGSILLEKYGSVINQIENDGFKVTASLYTIYEGNNPVVAVKTTASAMSELATWFDAIKPDVVVTIADRFETLATAVAASYMNIPLVHIQGGEITGNIDEKVRHSITKLADIHFVACENARTRVIRMGENSDNVYNTGCPSIDIAAGILKNQLPGFNPFRLYGGVGSVFNHRKPYIVVMQHPVTTEYGFAKEQIECTLNAIQILKIPTFWFWPNPDPGTNETAKGIRSFREINKTFPIRFFKNMESAHFLMLLKNASCLIGNSSVGIRECSFLGVPVVNIGSRQAGRDRASNVLDVDYDVAAITNAIAYQLAHGHYKPDFIYGNGDSGQKIAALLTTVPLCSHKTMTY
ncbi:UDP-N-acetylglucosamine 2-epimerase [Dyadobacter sp. NIV53]|uniref:UDP-N-acetylglucosamine 2-epimerase n=1 Tax=Dyadobacter sp. NIV53 TaxID=2861765 RepID=UPI001C879B98|nr:UDP-N-acetylglucosamine 2-epimerase [Dyadobacter sp. NIV53]